MYGSCIYGARALLGSSSALSAPSHACSVRVRNCTLIRVLTVYYAYVDSTRRKYESVQYSTVARLPYYVQYVG